jgi:hypothetical protein
VDIAIAPCTGPGMPNLFAYLALGTWPLVSLTLFSALPFHRALLVSIVGGYLLLPSSTHFSTAGLPDLNKAAIIGISAAMGAALFGRNLRTLPLPKTFLFLACVYTLSPIATALANDDLLVIGRAHVNRMGAYDGLSLAVQNLLNLVPMVLGYKFFSGPSGARKILVAISVGMLVYSIAVLAEVRMSPQLHRVVYGFHPHDFVQQVRGSGFRAFVFLEHGLSVASMLSMAVVSLVGLARSSGGWRFAGLGARWLIPYMAAVLFLQKTLGALLLGLGISAAVALLPVRRLITLSFIIVALVLAYPALRPVAQAALDRAKDTVSAISEERAASLEVRLVNEERLLSKASERPWLGWGTWGRNRIFDPVSGTDLSTTDGFWIIVLGSFGWVGYIAVFGLLTYPVVRLLFGRARYSTHTTETACLALLLTMNLIDLIPNSTITPITWLIAGALLASTARRGRAAGPRLPPKPVRGPIQTDPQPSSLSAGVDTLDLN